MKAFMPRLSTKNLKIQTFAIGAAMNGKNRTGLRTIGAPKRIGSLTAKQTGMMEARPTALSCADFARNAHIAQNMSVAPVPPIVATK